MVTQDIEAIAPDGFDAWRRRVGLSYRAAAAELGVSRSTIQRWIDGTNEPPLSVRLVCALLEMHIRDD